MARTLKSVKAMKALKAMKKAKAAAPAAGAPAMKPMKAMKRATHGILTVAKLAFLHRHKKKRPKKICIRTRFSDVLEIRSFLKVWGWVGAVPRRVARDAAQIRKTRR